jgi:hypothetical protein
MQKHQLKDAKKRITSSITKAKKDKIKQQTASRGDTETPKISKNIKK